MSSSRFEVGKVTTPPRARLLHRFVAAGNLRYLIISAWALALLTEVRAEWVVVWYVVTMLSGLARGAVESRSSLTSRPRARIGVAALSCVAWAAAPVLAWYDGHTHGAALAVLLISCGYLLVFTQMRAQPREALIVSAPYSGAALLILGGAWGSESFPTLAAMVPVLALVLLIKVIVTQLKDAELVAVNEAQRRLIADLELARDDAHAASEAKSNFLAVMSHELRTPLNGILGGAQLLEKATLAPSEKAYVGIIRSSGADLLALLNDILDLAKIEAGKLELRPDEITIGGLVDHAVGPFRAQAEAKGLTFSLKVDGAQSDVLFVDALRVSQVVQNLLSNAIKFTETGAVGLTVTARPASSNSLALTLEVADQGIGIAPNDLARLFQPFTQVDDSSTRRFGGSGLGLSICRRLARLLGGDITVRSTEGAGSIFTFTLTAACTHELAGGPASTVDAAPATSGLTVLVVEDHPVNRMLLESWLSSAGHQVVSAEDGGAGVVQAALQGFDLILMDINMPVMDGLAATRHIRGAGKRNANAPIIVLSASARREDIDQGFEAGADAYLTKPIDFAALARAIDLARSGRAAVATLSPSAEAA